MSSMNSFERDSWQWFSNTAQVVNDIHVLRKHADQRSLEYDRFTAGPHEATIDPEQIAEANERMYELTRLQIEQLEENDRRASERHSANSAAARRAEDRQEELNDMVGELLDEAHETLLCCSAIKMILARGVDHLASTVHELRSMRDQLHEMETSAQERHNELLAAVRSPLGNAAEEKYQQAVIQFDTGHFGDCASDLALVFVNNSTHVPAWTLFGRVAAQLGQPAVAKASYRRAAAYALKQKNIEGYIGALLRLSQLESLVGNVATAHAILVEMLSHVPKKHLSWYELCYEELKARWAIPKEQTAHGANQMARELRRLMGRMYRAEEEKTRRDVGQNPVFAQLREFCPWLRPGKYAELYSIMLPMSRNIRSTDAAMRPRDGSVRDAFPDFDKRLALALTTGMSLIERIDYGRAKVEDRWLVALLDDAFPDPMCYAYGSFVVRYWNGEPDEADSFEEEDVDEDRLDACEYECGENDQLKIVFLALQCELYRAHEEHPSAVELSPKLFADAQRVIAAAGKNFAAYIESSVLFSRYRAMRDRLRREEQEARAREAAERARKEQEARAAREAARSAEQPKPSAPEQRMQKGEVPVAAGLLVLIVAALCSGM